MASLYRRGRIWWTKFQHQGQIIRKSLKTSNRQLARERARHLECAMRDRVCMHAHVTTSTPLTQPLAAADLLRPADTHCPRALFRASPPSPVARDFF
jgi:hypothetical protein